MAAASTTEPDSGRAGAASISVIIPVIGEDERLPELLDGLTASGPRGLEILVIDGDSSPATRRIVEAHPATRWLPSPPGRARQLQAGAETAQGEILLFLHADTRLPDGWAGAVRHAAAQPRFALGAFRFALDHPARRYRFTEWAVRTRCRYARLPYGDQALFVQADSFRAAGGFADIPILEDVDLVRRMRRRGRIVVLRETAVTSARRYQQTGYLRLTWLHGKIILQYSLGMAPTRLATSLHAASRTVSVFCKYPEPGQVKTRLAAEIGDEDAARVYRRLVQDTLHVVNQAAGRRTVFFAPADRERDVRRWLGRRWRLVAQPEGDLGHRLLAAFRCSAARGNHPSLAIGTDCPDLTPDILDEAFTRLNTADLVLGPTEDGGYYLIGAHRPHPTLFDTIPWSTDRVLETTLARAREASLKVALLPLLRDVDTVDDFCHYAHRLGFSPKK